LTSLFLPTPQDTRSAKNDLCESGLWLEWMLIHWKKLKSYQWLEDRKLRLTSPVEEAELSCKSPAKTFIPPNFCSPKI